VGSTGPACSTINSTVLVKSTANMTIEHIEIPVLLNQLESALIEVMEQRQVTNPIVIGIHTGGVWIAEKIHQWLKIEEPLALLDISFYRDDFSQIGVNPKVKQSNLTANSLWYAFVPPMELTE
jgi:pyrimidine operon attenuation protein/uracil phosphoribosyltransferase